MITMQLSRDNMEPIGQILQCMLFVVDTFAQAHGRTLATYEVAFPLLSKSPAFTYGDRISPLELAAYVDRALEETRDPRLSASNYVTRARLQSDLLPFADQFSFVSRELLAVGKE